MGLLYEGLYPELATDIIPYDYWCKCSYVKHLIDVCSLCEYFLSKMIDAQSKPFRQPLYPHSCKHQSDVLLLNIQARIWTGLFKFREWSVV